MAHDRSAPTHEQIAALVLRRSKLTPAEGDLLRLVFPEIFHAHHDDLWQQLCKRGLREPQVEDLVQEAFLTLFSHILENGFPPNLPAQLNRIVRHKLLNHVRDARRAPESVALPSSGSEKPASVKEMERVLDLRELPGQLLPRLSPEHRDVIQRIVLQEVSVEDFAEETGLPQGTVRSRLMAAKRELATLAERILPPSQRDS